MSIKHDNNENLPDVPFIRVGPVQRVDAKESTRHKWVKSKTCSFRSKDLMTPQRHMRPAVTVSLCSGTLIVLGFNDISIRVGHFVSSPREREKRDSRGDEREGQVRKRNRNESEETEETKTFPFYFYLLQE